MPPRPVQQQHDIAAAASIRSVKKTRAAAFPTEGACMCCRARCAAGWETRAPVVDDVVGAVMDLHLSGHEQKDSWQSSIVRALHVGLEEGRHPQLAAACSTSSKHR